MYGGFVATVGDPRAATSAGLRPVQQVEGADWARWYVPRALGVDVAAALLAAGVAFAVQFGFDLFAAEVAYAVASGILPLVWVGLAVLHRAYEPRFVGVGSDEYRRVFNVGITFVAAVAILAYATSTDVARGYVGLALPLATLADIGGRYALRKQLHRLRRQGLYMRRVVVAGHHRAVAELVKQLRGASYHGMEIVGACLPQAGGTVAGTDGGSAEGAVPSGSTGEPLRVPVLGDLSEVPLAVETTRADTVAVLACPEMDGTALRRLAWQLEKTGTEFMVAPALMDVAGPRTTIRPIAGLPLLHVEHPELVGGRRLLKDLFDRITAGIALVTIAPVLAALALAVRATSPGPALFRQTRVGRDGREFTLLKLRTMESGADAHREALAAHNECDGVLFKMRADPRVTPLGAWLRRYSLDELPQLANVLRGDMSLVGPRPPLPEEVAEYGHDMRRRLVVRPGLTGLWQINGRSDLSWEESVRLDLRYVENWSLSLDIVILWKTVAAVLRASGAY